MIPLVARSKGKPRRLSQLQLLGRTLGRSAAITQLRSFFPHPCAVPLCSVSRVLGFGAFASATVVTGALAYAARDDAFREQLESRVPVSAEVRVVNFVNFVNAGCQLCQCWLSILSMLCMNAACVVAPICQPLPMLSLLYRGGRSWISSTRPAPPSLSLCWTCKRPLAT